MENGKVESEITEGKEEEVMEDEESKQSVLEEERGENTKVYSNLKKIMNGIWGPQRNLGIHLHFSHQIIWTDVRSWPLDGSSFSNVPGR